MRTTLLFPKSLKASSTAIALALTAFLLASTPARCGGLKSDSVLYAATGTFGETGVLYILDPRTGAVLTKVGQLNDKDGNNYGLTGLRYDPFNGVLYGATVTTSPTDPNYLVRVNPLNARVIPIGPFGNFLTDIAIDPATGVMYGVSGMNQKFYTVNIRTGLATQTGSTQIGYQNGGGLSSNSTGQIYGASNFSFYSYDLTTGNAQMIGSTHLRDFVRALAFDNGNALYGIEGGGGSDSHFLRFLVKINLRTGRGTEVGQSINDLDALAFVPMISD
jgi:hypothetical protein